MSVPNAPQRSELTKVAPGSLEPLSPAPCAGRHISDLTSALFLWEQVVPVLDAGRRKLITQS